MKLLHLDSSILGDGSASRALSAAIVERIGETHADVEVSYRDLVADPIPHMDLPTFMGLDSGPEVQQFLDSDIVVIGAGFYNFTFPSQLKSWIDRIAVRGKTFAYGENGPVGLVKGKRVIIALARGNVYGEGSPYVAFEHAETLLRSVFGFIGADVEFVIAEGLGRGDDARRASMDAALEQIRGLAPALATAG